MNTPMDADFFKSGIDELHTLLGGLLLNMGHHVLTSLAGIILISYTFFYGITGGLRNFAIKYTFRLVVATALLNYYDQPTSLLGGYSVSQFFLSLSEYLANYFNLQRSDAMYLYIAEVQQHMQQPAWMEIMQSFVMAVTQVAMILFEALCFASIALSYGALGVTILLGPLFIPWFIVPAFNQLFWNWLQATLQYSFYRVVAYALVFVVSTTTLAFLSRIIHGEYSVAHFTVILGKMIGALLADVFLILRIPSLVSDLFKGASSAASGFITSVSSLRRGVVR